MSTLGPVRRPPAKRPTWLIALLSSVGMVVLFAIGFGVSLLVSGEDERPTIVAGEADPSSPNAIETTEPEPCETTLIAAAEVLPRPDAVVVNVYNSTKRAGLAGATAQELSQAGFGINKVENDPLGVSLRGVGEIRFGPKGIDNARLLQFYVPDAVMVEDDRSGPRVDLSIGRSFEGLKPEGEVVASLASPSPSLSGPGCPVE
jgi:hypothetical protein